eukprot:gene12282-biopygen4335
MNAFGASLCLCTRTHLDSLASWAGSKRTGDRKGAHRRERGAGDAYGWLQRAPASGVHARGGTAAHTHAQRSSRGGRARPGPRGGRGMLRLRRRRRVWRETRDERRGGGCADPGTSRGAPVRAGAEERSAGAGVSSRPLPSAPARNNDKGAGRLARRSDFRPARGGCLEGPHPPAVGRAWGPDAAPGASPLSVPQ